MKTDLDFENIDTRKLLLTLDFQFFLNRNADNKKYSQGDLQNIYNTYATKLKEIEEKSIENLEQNILYTEGQVRKMFTGGFLPALFLLDESRSHKLLDFIEIGNNWAYFEFWKRNYQKKVTRDKIWDIILKTGSLLAILLAIIKLIETFQNYKYNCNIR